MNAPLNKPPAKASDKAAAHHFLTELRTRISTQPLPYQHGVEARALTSLWEVFGQAREAIKKNPGCELFASRTAEVLNLTLRPLTAKWHRAFEEGRLSGRDGADEFRGELLGVQEALREFTAELHQMAYESEMGEETFSPVMGPEDLAALFQQLRFGLTAQAPNLAEDVTKAINDDERAAVDARRKARGLEGESGTDAIGLALSGGGIRSATFCLGVVQVLSAKGLLQDVDFLSTVSGGGYTGCFLTERLGKGEPLSDVAAPHGPDPDPVRHVRRHAKFLSASNLKEKWAMVSATLAGTMLNWAAPLWLLMGFALAAHAISPGRLIDSQAMVGCGWVCVGVLALYGASMRMDPKYREVAGWLLALVFAFSAIFGVGWICERVFPDLLANVKKDWRKVGSLGALLASASAMAPTMIRFLPILKKPAVRKTVLQVVLWAAGLLVPLSALLFFYVFRALAETQGGPMLVATLFLAAFSIWFLDINLTGPHRMYRDGLARTFIQKSEARAPDVALKTINAKGTAPYHLLNAAVNVPSSESTALKDRGCDFFLFSKHWCGSPSTGYRSTKDWHANGSDIDLATAMAVSGAAFSSHMGLASMPALTSLLTMLNVRLGFWISNAGGGRWNRPGFFCLLREAFGMALTEKAKWLNLSDGGHIENLGVYELLRRRCKFIICVDGEADPGFTFEGLMTVVRHAQIDFGVQIAPSLNDIRPDPKTGFSRGHSHLCRVHYPDGGVGLLLYLKLSVTGNESELIRRYRTNNPDFPHQSTLDQFFDQEQFEAYRQLGVHAAESLFLPALMEKSTPTSVPTWFCQLAKNLLEPIKPGSTT